MRKLRENRESAGILLLCGLIFAVFLAVPMLFVLKESFFDDTGGAGFSLQFYREILTEKGFGPVILRSIAVSAGSAAVTTVLAFAAAYTIHFTNTPGGLKSAFRGIVMFPMLLPTITYGFAIIYTFGKQGLVTRLLGGHQLFDIYGWRGMMVGFVVYTLPVAFVLISNTMHYIDKKYLVISRVMGDRPMKTFLNTVLRPLAGTLVISVIQCFFLSFTDYGIPMAIGGRYEVLATELYNQMLGSFPDFHRGAVVAMIMLLPSAASILLMTYMQRFNVRYRDVTEVEIWPNRGRDIAWSLVTGLTSLLVIAIFAAIFIVPCVDSWPYRLHFTMEHFRSVFADSELTAVYWHSVFMAGMTALCGTLMVYGAGLASARSTLPGGARRLSDAGALIINTIPGMVLGIGYMLVFSGTSLQGSFLLLIACTMLHYFSTPFMMMENTLNKLDSTWETTGKLMGDSWLATVRRVITPNVRSTLAEVFSYYFLNAMVTVSAVIFIVSADTMLLTTKIQQLEHYQQFNDIFVLSILILVTNLAVKGIVRVYIQVIEKNGGKRNGFRKIRKVDAEDHRGGFGSGAGHRSGSLRQRIVG